MTYGLRAAATGFGSLAMTLLFTANAAAGTVLCPPSPLDPDFTRQYSLTTDPTASCYAYGGGNLNGAGNDAFQNADPGWDFEGQNSAFDTITGQGTNSGTFSFTAEAGLQYALGIKDGGNPKWAVFLLPDGVTSGSWGIVSQGGALSHLALYSRDGEPVEPGEEPIVPEPATVALLGLGLIAGGARLRRAKARA